MNVYIKRIPEKKSNLIILPESMLKKGEAQPRRMNLHVGTWRYEVEVEFRNDLPEKTIGFSSTLKIPFELPEQLPYEIKIQGRNLHVGPVIAFLAFTEKQDITAKSLNKYLGYLTSYFDIKGLIYICAVDGFDYSNQTIEGYYYNPEGTEDESLWKYGRFSYPDVLYLKIDVKKNDYEQIISAIGQNMLNTYLCDKWELWQWLNTTTQLCEHLPSTELLKDMQKLDETLAKYGAIYVKPVEAGKGKRLFKVDKTNGVYRFVDHLTDEICFNSSNEAKDFLSVLLSNENYLVQQAVSVTKYEDRCFVFRVIMQKNGSKHWNCSNITAYFGEAGGISANLKRTGIALNGSEALRKVFHMDEREVFLKEQEIFDLCITSCKTLEHSGGNYAELGIDIILDENLKVWLIEINHLHSHQPLMYKDKQMYLKMVTTPLEYAKSLAGFS